MNTCIHTECIFPSSLPGLGQQRTIGLGYTPPDQRERGPGPLVEPNHLQDLGLSHQPPVGRSDGQPDRVSTWAPGDVYADANWSVTSQDVNPCAVLGQTRGITPSCSTPSSVRLWPPGIPIDIIAGQWHFDHSYIVHGYRNWKYRLTLGCNFSFVCH